VSEQTEVNGKDLSREPAVVEEQPAPSTGIGSCIKCKWSSMGLTTGQAAMSCRREAPQLLGTLLQGGNGQLQWTTAAGWPNVTANDWCGKFEAAPERRQRTEVKQVSGVIAQA
jgi:hypothetical protein